MLKKKTQFQTIIKKCKLNHMPAPLLISKFLKVVNLQKQLMTLNLQSISLVALKNLRHNELMQLQETTNLEHKRTKS